MASFNVTIIPKTNGNQQSSKQPAFSSGFGMHEFLGLQSLFKNKRSFPIRVPQHFLCPRSPRFGNAPLPSPTSQPKRHDLSASLLAIRLKLQSSPLSSTQSAILWRSEDESLLTHITREAATLLQ